MKQTPEYLAKLTPNQLAAATYTGKRLMIVAGAGTGKTTTIASRIAWLIEQGIKPENILALTFTDKAAKEMEGRVDQLLPYGVFGTTVCTFHRFGEQILRRYGHTLGINEKTRVLTEVEQQIFLKNHISDLPLKVLRPISNPYNSVKNLLKFFATLKDNLTTPTGEVLGMSNDDVDEDTKEALRAYPVYQELMAKNNMLDFADLIYKSVELLKQGSAVRKEVQNKYKYILIDEFQDTNYAQIELMKVLVGEETSLTVVGDDDQSIYRFRGATVGQMEMFKSIYTDTKIITLTDNFRSTQPILDNAYALIQHNNPHRLEHSAKINKKLVSQIGGSELENIEGYAFSNDFDEADWVIEDIVSHSKERHFEDCCVLVRSNAAANIYMQKFTAANIAFTTKTEFGIADDPMVRVILALFHIVANPKDYMAFFTLATSAVYAIPSEVVVPIIAEARNTFLPPEDCIADNQQKLFTVMLADIAEVRANIAKVETSELALNFIKTRELINKFDSIYGQNTAQMEATVVTFITICKRFESISRHATLLHFLEDEELLLADSGLTTSENMASGVNLLTIHSAKGLEFETVYLTNMADGRFPNIERSGGIAVPSKIIKVKEDEDEHIREERRLCYVAITRAKTRLVLTYAKFYNGGVRERKPSRFITEMQPLTFQLPNSELITQNKPEISNRKPEYVNKTTSIAIRGLEDYERCPYHFKLIHLDKVPIKDSPNLQIGRIMHQVFESYFRSVMESKALNEVELRAIFEAGFDNRGHESEALRDERKADCLAQITNFYQFFSTYIKPTDVEFDVAFKIDGLILKGRIDFITNTKDPVIIDFKTGSVKNVQKAQEKADDSLQIKTYAYYYFNKFNKIPRAALYFPSSNVLSYAKIDEKVIFKTEEKISKIISNIKAGNFKPKPSNVTCQNCSARDFCPYAT